MASLNENQEYAISKFLERYDYDAVLDILEEAGIIEGDLYFLIESCQYSVNFEFKKAIKSIQKMSSQMLSRREIKKLITNLNNLEIGEPEDILSELIENIKIQIVNGEYIDFLGRLYRLKEALFNYKKEMVKYTNYSDNWFVFGGDIYLSRTTIDGKKDYYFELAGVRRITNHEFRHSIITYLVNTYIENCNKKNISIDTEKFFIMLAKRDGHTPETLKKNYLHLFPTVQNEIVDLLDNS